MIDGKPSQTALMVAAMRAYHHAFAPEPKILNDNLAMALGGFPDEGAVKATYDGTIAQFAAISDQDTAEIFVRRIAESVCMRSRLVEGQLQEAMKRGLKQVVILGAGLDSTFYRLAEISGLKLFEVDYPATQIWKRERLEAVNVEVPANVKFVPFDFENQTLASALKTGGVNHDAMTLFSWLGVQPYLTDEAVRATMRVVAKFPRGSEVIMDFVSPRYEDSEDINADGLDQLSAVVETMGEPFMSRYTPDDLKALLLDCGFSGVTLYKSEQLIERFLGGKSEAYAMPKNVIAQASAQV